MIQDGIYINLGEPTNSLSGLLMEYAGTSQQRQGLAECLSVVGLTRSTRSLGEPSARGRGQRWCGSFSDISLPDTWRLEDADV